MRATRDWHDDDRGDYYAEANAARAMRRRDAAQAAEFERTGWPVGEDDDEMGDVA